MVNAGVAGPDWATLVASGAPAMATTARARVSDEESGMGANLTRGHVRRHREAPRTGRHLNTCPDLAALSLIRRYRPLTSRCAGGHVRVTLACCSTGNGRPGDRRVGWPCGRVALGG